MDDSTGFGRPCLTTESIVKGSISSLECIHGSIRVSFELWLGQRSGEVQPRDEYSPILNMPGYVNIWFKNQNRLPSS